MSNLIFNLLIMFLQNLYYYLLLSAFLPSSGDSGVTPGIPLDSNKLPNREFHLNQVEIQVWFLNLHFIAGGQPEEGSKYWKVFWS